MAVGFLSPVPAITGLNLISTNSFTTQSSVSFNNVFTSTYQNYRVLVNLSAVSELGANIYWRFRASGTDTSANYAWSDIFGRDNGTTFATGNTNSGVSSSWQILYSYGAVTATSLDIFSPQESRRTLGNFIGWGGDSSTWYSVIGGGVQTGTTSFDGFTIFPNTGTISGSIRVYGYQNS